MALRRELTRRLIATSPSSPTPLLPRRSYISSPDTASRGFFRRFLQRRAINQSTVSSSLRLPEMLSLPVGERLRERLSEMNMNMPRLGGFSPTQRPEPEEEMASLVTVEDVKRIVRAAQLGKVKERLRSVPEIAVPYDEFVRLCVEACGGRGDQGLEFAKVLDDTSNVVVLGNVVFLRPGQVAKSVEKMIWQSWAGPKDPRRKELEEMEKEKAQIDKKAEKEVRRELYGGLALMVAQTLGFMRLTFWELSWDVMEPICFSVTSMHFAMAYTFFLRTSTEPSFEGFFRTRFRVKQAKIMRLRNFDVDKFERLSKTVVYPPKHDCCC